MHTQKQRQSVRKLPRTILIAFACACVAFLPSLAGCSSTLGSASSTSASAPSVDESSLSTLSWSGSPTVEVNDNNPSFSESDLSLPKGTEKYGKLDSKDRCTTAIACVGTETMSDDERGSISSVHPTGWVQASYSFLSSDHLYERCHLIAYCLTAENANKRNLITGTHYLNISGMLPYEEQVLDYVRSTSNHVIYEVTPVFNGNNLVASGVHMQAESVEDRGAGISFNVYCFNVEPGIIIDYATGESEAAEGSTSSTGGDYSYSTAGNGSSTYTYTQSGSASSTSTTDSQSYVINTSSKKFHTPSCSGVEKMSAQNKETFEGSREELIAQGYAPCGICNP